MLHVNAVLTTVLLATHACLIGDVPSIALVTYFLLLRSPRSAVPKPVVMGIVVYHATQIVASLVLNLVTSTNATIRESVFGETGQPSLAKAFGMYEMSSGSAWKYAASVVPSVVVAIVVFASRHRLSRHVPYRRLKVGIKWTLAFWGAVNAAAALIEPTIVGGVFLVSALLVFSCIAFDSFLLNRTFVRGLAGLATLLGVCTLVTFSVAQNYAASSLFRKEVSPMIGFTVFCNFTQWRDLRVLVQYALILLATVIAQIVAGFSDRLPQASAQYHQNTNRSAMVNKQQTGGQDDATERTHLTATLLSHSQDYMRIARSSVTQSGRSHSQREVRISENAGAASESRLRGALVLTPDDAASVTGTAISESFLARGVDIVGALMNAFRFATKWVMNNFIVLPLFPMICVAALIIVFPALPSLSLFFVLLLGTLFPEKVRTLLLPFVAMFGALFVAQYYIYATVSSSMPLLLFLHESSVGWQLVEIACNLVVFLVLLTTYVQQVQYGSEQDRQARQQREEQESLAHDLALLARAEEITSLKASHARRHRQDSSAEDTEFPRDAPSSSSTRFLHHSETETEQQLLDSASRILTPERVDGIRRVFYRTAPTAHVSSSSRVATCFSVLMGRSPTEAELHKLQVATHEDPFVHVIRKRRLLAVQPLWRQVIHDVSILLNFYSQNFTTLFTFIAGSCVVHLDIIHAIVLCLFIVYFVASDFARRRWGLLVVYIAGLTIFESLVTFIAKFETVPLRVLPEVKATTVGLVPLPTRWSAIPYFVVFFFVCGQYHVLRSATYSWDELFTLYEWRQLLNVSAIKSIRQRITLFIAAAVFVALGVFEDESLFVEGFLLFFMVICICTAYSAPTKVLRMLWQIACGYAGLVIIAVCLYQFPDLAAQVDSGFAKLSRCNTTALEAGTTCPKELGVVAPEGYVLTYFLAPWFIALVTSVAHIASVSGSFDENAEVVVSTHPHATPPAQGPAVTGHHNGGREDAPLIPSTRQQQSVAVNGSVASFSRGADGASHNELDNHNAPTSASSSRNGRAPSTAEMRCITGDTPRSVITDDEETIGATSSTTTSITRRFCFPDQCIYHFIAFVVWLFEWSGVALSWLGREFGPMLVWVALYVAATTEYSLMASAYALFFVLDLSSITSLVYCVLHLLVLYSYQFSFTPEITVDVSVDWAQLLGLIKGSSSKMQAIGPVLVFFAVLFRINTAMTTQKPVPEQRPQAEPPVVEQQQATTAADRSRPSAVQELPSRGTVLSVIRMWASYINQQGFYLIGFELFVLLSILNVQVSCRVAAGSAMALTTMLTMIRGRQNFFSSRIQTYLLRAFSTVCFAFELLIQLNNSRHLWDTGSPSSNQFTEEEWRYWGLSGRVESLFLSFACLVVLHCVGEKRRRSEANPLQEERVELCIQRLLYHRVMGFQCREGHAGVSSISHAASREDTLPASCCNLQVRLKRVHYDDEKRERLLEDGFNAAQPHKKRMGNVLKHCNDTSFNLMVPNTNPDDVVRALEVTFPSVSGGVAKAMMSEHFRVHHVVMSTLTLLVSGCSPVAFLSFAAGTISPSIYCLALMVGGLLQFSFQEILHWKFYRWWPQIERGYFFLLLGVPVVVNIPVIASWVVEHESVSSVFGLSESSEPLGVNAIRAALLFFIALQSRVYEEFWFDRVLRRLRKNAMERTTKHDQLMEVFEAEHSAQLRQARDRDLALRQKLQVVRSMYLIGASGGQVGAAVDNRSSFDTAAAFASPKVVDETQLSIPGHSLPSTDATAGGGDASSPQALKRKSAALSRLSLREELSNSSLCKSEGQLLRGNSSIAAASEVPAAEGTSACAERADGTTRVGDAANPQVESEAEKPPLYHRLQERALAATEALIPYTFWPEKHTKALLFSNRFHPFLCLVIVLYRVLERYTSHLVVVFVAANYAQSGTAFDIVPVTLCMTVVAVYHPFAPLKLYDFLSAYIVVGIVAKALALILMAHLDVSSSFLRFLTWALVSVAGETSGAVGNGAFSDLILDFFTFASIVVHKHIALSNGVYSDLEIHPPTEPEDADGKHHEVLSEEDEDAEHPGGLVDGEYRAVGFESHPEPQTTPPPLQDSERSEVTEDNIVVPIPQSQPADAGNENDDAKPVHILINFFYNATTVQGVGVDLYVYYALAEFVTLIILVANYYSIAGGDNGSIIQNVQDNVLPGPFVIAVLATLLAMLVDRMVYAADNMRGKLAFHAVYTLAIMILYCVWRNVEKPPVLQAGIVLFSFKCVYLYLSCWQLRKGFPIHRRHDPFSHLPDDILPWIGYQVYRSVPFLWEMRVVTDWTVSRTALRLPCYLKVENLFDTVYNRYVSIGESRAQQPIIGTAVKASAKVADGVVRLVVILFAVLFPLLYYSTFNPVMGSNQITQISIDVSFENSAPFFSSSLFSILEYPGDLAMWLARTRPVLGSYGITKGKDVQLIDLSSCSNTLWGISPQAQRLLTAQLNETFHNVSATSLNLQVSVTRGGSVAGTSTGGSVTQNIRHPWNLPWNVAGDIFNTINNVSVSSFNDSMIIPLPNFYSPYVFNQPTQVQYFPAMTNDATLDTEECSIVLRTEFDPMIQSPVHYWCLKCNSIFSSGNYPNPNLKLYPEWNCLTKGVGCQSFNFELHATNYTPVPMYFVFFSDPIPQQLSFLPNIGLIAIYTTFVLALGRVFRGMFSSTASNIVQTDMADPTPVAQLIEFIAIARAYGDLPLEQSIYYELIDLLRSPERLLQVTGLNKRMYDANSDGQFQGAPAAT